MFTTLLPDITMQEQSAIAVLTVSEKARLDAIIAMHTLVLAMNDETVYEAWVQQAVPDQPQLDDFLDFAYTVDNNRNPDFDEAVTLFKQLWQDYGCKEKGIYIANQTY